MNLNFFYKSLIIGIILGFLFMTIVAWANDVLVTMLIGTNWNWAMEEVDIITFNGIIIRRSIPRVALYVETNVFIWKTIVPWLCACILYLSSFLFNIENKKEILKKSFIFGLIIWGCTICWFSIEDWWGFFLRNLFPSVDPEHTLPYFFTYEKYGHPWDINIYGEWVPIWIYIGQQLITGLIIIIIGYLMWRHYFKEFGIEKI